MTVGTTTYHHISLDLGDFTKVRLCMGTHHMCWYKGSFTSKSLVDAGTTQSKVL